MHLQSLGSLMRELAHARDVEHIAGAIREYAPPLLGAERVTLVVGADPANRCTPHNADGDHTMVPVGDGQPGAAIEVCWRSPHRATGEQMAALDAVADAISLALEKLRLARAVQVADARAQQSQRESETRLAMIGHELRQPLGAIVNAMTTLQRHVSAEDRERAQCIVARQVDQLRRITDDLLDAVQMQRGTLMVDVAPLDAVGAVSECVDAVRCRVDDRRQSLTFSSSAPTLWMPGTAGAVRRIVSNLLDNAVKYTPAGGSIDVSVASDGGWIVIRVRDSGRGITPEQLPRIFDLFFQGNSGSGGVGIGLAVVKWLTEAQGGRFEACSEGQGRGSMFTVRFPACATPAPTLAIG